MRQRMLHGPEHGGADSEPPLTGICTLLGEVPISGVRLHFPSYWRRRFFRRRRPRAMRAPPTRPRVDGSGVAFTCA